MASAVDALVLDLVEWIAKEPRLYSDVIDAWRTSCPRLMVWEEATDRGFVERHARTLDGAYVVATPEGRDLLKAHGRPSA